MLYGGLCAITGAQFWRALRVVKAFDLNCLHNHFKKCLRHREGFTHSPRTFSCTLQVADALFLKLVRHDENLREWRRVLNFFVFVCLFCYNHFNHDISIYLSQ